MGSGGAAGEPELGPALVTPRASAWPLESASRADFRSFRKAFRWSWPSSISRIGHGRLRQAIWAIAVLFVIFAPGSALAFDTLHGGCSFIESSGSGPNDFSSSPITITSVVGQLGFGQADPTGTVTYTFSGPGGAIHTNTVTVTQNGAGERARTTLSPLPLHCRTAPIRSTARIRATRIMRRRRAIPIL